MGVDTRVRKHQELIGFFKYCVLTHTYGIQKDDTDESIFRAAMEMQTQRTDLWSQRGGKKERVGLEEMERVKWKHIH